MKKILLLFVVLSIGVISKIKSQVIVDTISSVTVENQNTQFCFNNTKLMAGNTIADRYLIYYNPDTIFLSVNQSGNWTRKIAYTGSNIQSASLTFYQDTIWLCWKEGFISAQIKALYTSDKGASWSSILAVSPIGKVSAPSLSASSNGKIHFVWSQESSTDTTIYYTRYLNGAFLPSPAAISNSNGQGLWPSVIAIGDTVLCAWKEDPLPSKVWFRSSFDGGITWNAIPTQPTTTVLSTGKDPNLAYAYDANTLSHYVYLVFDGQNKIYLQRSTNLGSTWSNPTIISSINKLSQFAHIEINNSGFVGVSYEQRPMGTSLFDDSKKDVGFTYSTNWGSNGSFSVDTIAYTFNGFGSAYPGFNKIDEGNFYLAWLTKDTINNSIEVFERLIQFNSALEIKINDHPVNQNSKIFPNPFSTQTTFQTEIHLRNADLTVYNLHGHKVKQIHNVSGQTITLDRDNLLKGLYFIELTQAKQVIALEKLIIID